MLIGLVAAGLTVFYFTNSNPSDRTQSQPSPNRFSSGSTDGGDNVAPSRAHLEWSDAEYRRYRARLSEIRQTEPFADSGPLIEAFMKDANTLHTSSRIDYERLLDNGGSGDEEVMFPTLFDNPNVAIETVVEVAKDFDRPDTNDWKSDCVSQAQKALADLARSDIRLDQLARLPEDQETVRELRTWSTVARSVLNEVFVYAEADNKFATVVTTEHGEMIEMHVRFELILHVSDRQ